MAFRNGLAAAAAMAIAVGAGFELRSAQSFTIPNACVEGSACAYVCTQRPRTRPDRGRLHRACRLSARSRAADRSAARQPVDAGAGRSAQCLCRRRRRHVQSRCRRAAVAGLFAQPRDRQGRRDRSGDLQGHRQPGRDAEPGAYRSVLGSADALGFGGRERARRPRRRRADRSEDRQARQSDRRARFLQHLFHPRRQIGDRRRRGDAAARVPRSPYDGAAGLHRDAAMRGDQPRRFFARRLLCDLHLRIQRLRSPRSISSITRSSRRCR